MKYGQPTEILQNSQKVEKGFIVKRAMVVWFFLDSVALCAEIVPKRDTNHRGTIDMGGCYKEGILGCGR